MTAAGLSCRAWQISAHRPNCFLHAFSTVRSAGPFPACLARPPSVAPLVRGRLVSTLPRPPSGSKPLEQLSKQPFSAWVLSAFRRSFSQTPRRPIRPQYYGGGSPNRPQNTLRQRIDSIDQTYLLFTIIVLNAIVYACWEYGTTVMHRFRDPSWILFLNENFTSSWKNMKEGRVWTLLTACFSHEGGSHIFLNMLSFFFMAPPVMQILGNARFLGLYLGAGIVVCATSLFVRDLQGRKFVSSHGASGAVYGCISFFAACYPRTTFLIFFVIPMPAWLCVSGIMAWDAFTAMTNPGSKTDTAGHLGGAFTGLAYYFLKARRIL